MIQTKLIVIMVCLLSVVFFSGCTTKYITKSCYVEVEEEYTGNKCNQNLNQTEFAKCASKSFLSVLKDRNVYKAHYESCK